MHTNDEDRILTINKIRIFHPELSEITEKLANCHKRARLRPEPPCMIVTGLQGVGKTTLYESYAERYPRVETDEGTIVPCLTAMIPVPATVSGLVSEILDALGDPAPELGNIPNRTLRLRRLLKNCKTEIIFLDEFQHVIDRDLERVLKTTADWLKILLNNTRIPVVLLGMPSCTIILEANPQLRRRFSIRRQLMPFAWTSSTEDGKTDYPTRKLLKLIEKQLPLKQASNLADHDTAYRIYAASGGVIDSIMKLIRGAAELAIDSGQERITLKFLSDVYDDELAANQPNIPNPFKVKMQQILVAEPTYQPTLPQKSAPKRRGRLI